MTKKHTTKKKTEEYHVEFVSPEETPTIKTFKDKKISRTLTEEGSKKDDTPTVTHHSLHPHAIKEIEDVEQWYTEKNRISIGKIQIPTDTPTEYYFNDMEITQKLMGWTLFFLTIFLIGIFI